MGGIGDLYFRIPYTASRDISFKKGPRTWDSNNNGTKEKKKSHALGGSRFQPHAQRIFPAAGTLYRLGMPLVCRRVSRESASRIIGKIAAIMEMREYVCGQTSVSPSVRGASHFQEIFRVLCMDMRAFPITPALPFKAVKGIRQVVSFSCCLCGKDCFS